MTANQVKIADGAGSGRFDIILTAEFGGKNKAGQPIIWATNSSGISTPSWNNIQTKGIVLLPTKKNDNQPPVDLTDGPKDYSGNDGRGLSEFVHNPNTGLGNPILNKNKEWPEGTKFEWIGKDGVHELKLDKAGESKTGDIKITLPTGSSYTVKDITVTSKANVKAENKTIDYGTVLTAADLVANKNVFPKGTTYQFAGNEPNWKKAGSYSEVKITATYNAQSTDSQGKITTHQVTTPVATCAVAINDIRQITVLEGSKTPDVNSVLNFPDTWEAHTAEYSTDINTNETNQGVITVHYPASNLDQTIKVYVTVIPKTTAVDGLNFKTDGSQIGGNNKLIDSDGAFLTTAGNNDIAYQGYDITTQPGVASNVTPASKDYKPSYSLIGLKEW
ncbi:MAG: Rib/alpha-like domain-containing protein [Limosilactobacillus pontis]